MGYKGNLVQGEIPESGAIFMSNIKTKDECLERKLFGLPSGMSDFVLNVKKGMTLFLFEFERRLLYGVFRATCDGETNIERNAFRSSGKQFPAQVRFKTVWDCSPLAEHEFKGAIKDNYYSAKKFHFGLNEKQVSKLMKLFHSKRISKNHPERNIPRYDDQTSEGNARSRDLRTDISHRLRFGSSDFRGDEVKEVDDNMYINKHIIEARPNDKREGFPTHYTTETDEFGAYDRHDILGKRLDLREKHIEDDYMSIFSKPHRNHLDGFGVGSSKFLMDGENKDIIDYNRLHDEYEVRKSVHRSLNEHHHVFSRFNQNDYSNSDLTGVPDSHLSPPCFDDGSSYIPIANDYPFYRSPEKISLSKPLPYYSPGEGLIRYRDDPGSQGSIYPKFISRNLSSSDAGVRLHEVDPAEYDKPFYGRYESKHMHTSGSTDKRVSVFSRLTSSSRHEEHAYETDDKPKLDASVDKVMEMLEKVVSSPRKRTRKSRSVIKQDDDNDDNSADSKIEEDHAVSDVNEVDADVANEEVKVEVEGESVFQETRLVDFKRRKKSNMKFDDASKEKSNMKIDDASKESSACPVETDQSTGMPHKRRKLVRPAFVENNIIPDGASAHRNALPENDSLSTKVVVETSEKVFTEDVRLVPSCHEKTYDDSNLTKTGIESSSKADVSCKPIDLNMPPACDECSPSKYDNTPTKALLESLHMTLSECQRSENEKHGVAGKRVVSDVFVEATLVGSPKDDEKMCGWIDS